MNSYTFSPKYEIGDKIYHLTPGSDQGIIIDISFLVSTREIKYLIAIGFSNEIWAQERELSKEKTII